MSKPIYKPTKPYSEDINDLIEKGGVGSGIKGHTTAEKAQAKDHVKQALGVPVETSVDGNKIFGSVNAQMFSEKEIMSRLSPAFKEAYDVKVKSSVVSGKKILNVSCTRKNKGMASGDADKRIQENDKKINENSSKLNSDMTITKK